jgi:glycosyltransferase involved in cell wall biosynthesis
MKRVVIDAYNFVGLRGGSGGSGSYVLSLIEHLARLIEVRVIASARNARLFNALSERVRRLNIHVGDGGHADSICAALEDADILYAPFTSLPERARYSLVPAVAAIHDLQHRVLTSIFPEPERVARDDAYFYAASDADGVLTFSHAERDNIDQAYNVVGPIGVVPHAPFLAEEIERSGQIELSPDHNPYRAKYGRYVLYPAVNWPHKNHYRLIEAFRFLCETYGLSDVKLILTGASCVEPREHFYKALLDQPWAKGRVVELGFVSNTQLFLLMKGAEVLAFPSMYEGFGIPVLESLRLRTPVIASNLRVMQEWFGGCFQPFGNIRNSLTMAQDLYALLTNPGRQAALAKAGFERSGDFSSKRMAEETLNFLSGVVEESYRPKRRHGTPHRDMAQLRRKSCQLLFHILVDNLKPSTAGLIRSAIDALRAKLPGLSVGFVCVVPAGIAVPAQQVGKAKIDGRKRPTKNKLGAMESSEPLAATELASSVDAIKELSAQLSDTGIDVIYFDDRDDGPGRAIRFYVSTQVDSAFHCFAGVQQLDALAADEPLAAHCLQVASKQAPDEVDGYYGGAEPWPLARDRIVQAVHEEPWSFEDRSQSSIVPVSHQLILSDKFVRGQTFNHFGESWTINLMLRARIVYPKPRFAYIETELKQRVGHHFALVTGLCEVAQAGGLEPLVGANIDAVFDGMSDDIQVDPYFSSYSQAPEEHVTPSHFADELLAFIDRHKIGASDYVYLHMPYSTLIAGVLQIVATSRLESLPVFLIRICSVDESFRWHDIRETSCIRAITELGGERRKRIRLFVESLPLQKYFEEAAGETLPVLLNPVFRELAVARLASDKQARRHGNSEPLAFGYFGEAREEKGFQILPGIIEGLLSRYGSARVRFLLQVSASPQNDTEKVRSARLQLEKLAETHKASGAVLLFDNFGDMDGYYTAIANCDAMLMPYDPRSYRIRGSGVALEALALGVPIIVALGTDMAETFEGPGCIVASSFSEEAFVQACSSVVEHYPRIAGQLGEYVLTCPLIQSEAQYLRTLIGFTPKLPTDVPDERPVALWIGNDVLSQGCSAVYDAQRAFLRRHGFEIYNVYVPFPDINGHLQSDEALEKHLLANSLGWRRGGYDFGCYAWTLNQSDDDLRRSTLQEIAADDGSSERLLRLNSYNTCPPGLLRLVENRKVDLVCLNYVHLLPVVEKLGLLGRRGTRVVLESHDIQAYQYAARAGRKVDEEDKELEITRLSDADAVVAISRGEYDEIRELNPWVNSQFVLPTIRIDPTEWTPGVSHLTPDWLDIWHQRSDLQAAYDLRTPEALAAFRSWIMFYGRLEYSNLVLNVGLNSVALAPHPDFRLSSDGTAVSTTIGETWHLRADVRAKWPNAPNPNHPDRAALLQWALDGGMKEMGFMPNGGLPPASLARSACSSSLLEALVLAQPVRMSEPTFRTRLVQWLVKYGRIDVIIVGSDHPANLKSIRWFIEEIFEPHLRPQGVNLLLVGRSAGALQLEEKADDLLFALGEVERLDCLYKMASVVAAPILTGSGTPIKVLDAFARGLCVSVSSFVDRALGLSSIGFPMADEPSDFAADILGLLKSPKARQERIGLAKQFAEAHLSTAVYDAKWEEMAGLGASPPRADQSGSSQVPEAPAAGGKDAVPPLKVAKARRRAKKEFVSAD